MAVPLTTSFATIKVSKVRQVQGSEPVDADVERLAVAMERLASFLAAHEEPAWAARVSKDAARVRDGDGRGVTHFLEAFGGMGSLGDLTFDPANGNARTATEAALLNRSFQTLLRDAWRLARALRHEAET